MSPVTVLLPPEKLVLQVRASGEYNTLRWFFDGRQITTTTTFSNFREVYVKDTTTINDFGLYEVVALTSRGGQVEVEADLLVIQTGISNTSTKKIINVLYFQCLPIPLVSSRGIL